MKDIFQTSVSNLCPSVTDKDNSPLNHTDLLVTKGEINTKSRVLAVENPPANAGDAGLTPG